MIQSTSAYSNSSSALGQSSNLSGRLDSICFNSSYNLVGIDGIGNAGYASFRYLWLWMFIMNLWATGVFAGVWRKKGSIVQVLDIMLHSGVSAWWYLGLLHRSLGLLVLEEVDAGKKLCEEVNFVKENRTSVLCLNFDASRRNRTDFCDEDKAGHHLLRTILKQKL